MLVGDVIKMDRRIFEQNVNKRTVIKLKPNGFVLDGVILNVFDDCFEFETTQRRSYIDFNSVMSLIPEE